MDRAILLVKERLIDTVRVTLHCERAISQMRKQHRRDADVIIDHLPLGEPGFRVKDLVQVRVPEVFSSDEQLRFSRHRSDSPYTTFGRNGPATKADPKSPPPAGR